jgi:hypothetical protein
MLEEVSGLVPPTANHGTDLPSVRHSFDEFARDVVVGGTLIGGARHIERNSSRAIRCRDYR